MRWIVVLASALALLAAGCGGGEGAPKPSASEGLTVDEYVEWCGARERSNALDYTTWGDAVEALDEAVDGHEGVSPPSVLRAWHNAKIKAMAATAVAIRDGFDLDGYIDPIEALGIVGEIFFELGVRDKEAEALPGSIHSRLVAEGCIDEEDS